MDINWTTLKEAIGSAFKITSAIALLSGSGILLMYCFQIRYWPVDLASLPGISGAIFVLSLFFLFLMLAPSVATYLLVCTRAVTKLFDSRRAFWSGVLITILQLLIGCAFAYVVLFFITSSSAKLWNGLYALICLLLALTITRALIYWSQIRRDFDKAFRPRVAKNRKMPPESRSRRQLTRLKQFATVFGISSFGGLLAFLGLLAFVLRDVIYKVPVEPRTILVTDVWSIALILALPLLISNLAVIFSVTRGPNSSLDRTLSVLLFCMTYFIGLMVIIQFQFHGALLACTGIGDLRGCRLIVREEAIPVLQIAGYQVGKLTAEDPPSSPASAKLAEARDVHILLAVGSDYLIAARPTATPNKAEASQDGSAHSATLPRQLVVSVFR